MRVKSRAAEPVKQKDGSWKVVVREFYEDIPDLGRHTLMCNDCGEKSYPKCCEWCPVEQNRLERIRKGKLSE